jgi:uncharacterized protein (TIGR02147 family)
LGHENQRTGKKKDFANLIGCQSSFLSQVLTKKVNLSLEQGIKANSFFHHNDLESHFFMLLLHIERSGSIDLKKYYDNQLQEIRISQKKLKNHVKEFSEISEKIQAQFYSSWKFQAIQTLLSIRKLQSPESLSNYLSIPLSEVIRILEFLIENNLATREGNKYVIGSKNIHLSENSNFLMQHHINWKLRSMDSLNRNKNSNDLHYSAVITISESDVIKLRKEMIDQLRSNLNFIQESNEEVGYVMCLDLFNLGSS